MLKHVLICINLLFLPVFAFAATSPQAQLPTILKQADDYFSAVNGLMIGANKAAVEDVYHQGQAVAYRLVNVLESLSDTDYQSVETKMLGFSLNRVDSVYVEPDVVFFLSLSKNRGAAADKDFFVFLGGLKLKNGWPVYREWLPDNSGCTAFGRGVLTDHYRNATAFQKKYPAAYRTDIDEALGQLRREFSESTCACGDRESVTKEFALFIAAFPDDAIAPLVRKRMAEVKSAAPSIRFKCTSDLTK